MLHGGGVCCGVLRLALRFCCLTVRLWCSCCGLGVFSLCVVSFGCYVCEFGCLL